MTLPRLSDREQAEVELAGNLIRKKIDSSSGRISFHDFMNLSLYDYNYGYYNSYKYKLGCKGDFITAPLVSPLFSYSFANIFSNIMKKDLQFKSAVIVEFGAGNGKFAVDCITRLLKINSAPRNYIIIETSTMLVNVQKQYLKEKLPSYYPYIMWCNSIPETVSSAIVFANEVLDAMPVELFKYCDNNIYQQMVVYDDLNFYLEDNKSVNSRLKDAVLKTGITRLKHNNSYVSEVNLWVEPWLRMIRNKLHNAVVFICDYGYHRQLYYQLERRHGTLRCHYKHHVHNDPLINIGMQDITAHVDFTSVAEAAVNNDFELEGYSQQNNFLLSAGILDLYKNCVRNLPPKSQMLLTQELKRLILGSDFCDSFKVMILSLNYKDNVNGYLPNYSDLSYLL